MSDERSRLAILSSVLRASVPTGEPGSVLLGVQSQDDAAVIQVNDDTCLVISSDFIRGTGFYLFELGHMDYFDLGYYLVSANLSDIAAMGVRPTGMTTVVRYGPGMSDEQFKQIFEGINSAASKYGVEIVGGDTGSYSADVFSATAFGFASRERILQRSGAKLGDLLCVTGTVGLPITAIIYFKRAKSMGLALPESGEEQLLTSWRRPAPRILEGSILSEHALAHSCQDVSDGLKATIEQISLRSGVTFTVYAERLPVHEITRIVAQFLGISVPQLAMSASVDFELVFTIPVNAKGTCDRLFEEHGLRYSVIGETNSTGRNEMTLGEVTVPLPGTEWSHQTGDLVQQVLGQP
jgi:thiamine-monophosphate kinase